MEAVHGVTIDDVHSALRRNDGNVARAEQQLKVIFPNTELKKKKKKKCCSISLANMNA